MSTKSDVVYQLVKDGKKPEEILKIVGAYMDRTIWGLMKYGPKRAGYCRCAFISGISGVGKSTLVKTGLEELGIPYFVKMGGLNKYWDGYQYEPITLIDDPGLFNRQFGTDQIDAFKDLVSFGPCLSEVKFGSIQNQTRLLIVISNFHAIQMSDAAGDHAPNHTPIMRRLKGDHSLGDYNYISNKKQCRFVVTCLLRDICAMFKLE